MYGEDTFVKLEWMGMEETKSELGKEARDEVGEVGSCCSGGREYALEVKYF